MPTGGGKKCGGETGIIYCLSIFCYIDCRYIV